VERAFATVARTELTLVEDNDLRAGYAGMIVVTGRKK
jgi:hypothetical protein